MCHFDTIAKPKIIHVILNRQNIQLFFLPISIIVTSTLSEIVAFIASI